MAYTLISTQTLANPTASVTFSGIPQNFKDLMLEMQVRQSGTTYNARFRVNGDTGSNYSNTYMYGTGSATASSRTSNQTGFIWPDMSDSTSQPGNIIFLNLMQYANTNVNKTMLMRWAGYTRGYTWAEVDLWRSTAAITSVSLDTTGSETYQAGSTFKLWGVS